MKLRLLLPSLTATVIVVASAADPREDKGLRDADNPDDREVAPRFPPAPTPPPEPLAEPTRESSGRVIISRKTKTKMGVMGMTEGAIDDLRARGMAVIEKMNVVFESLGEGDYQVVDVGRGNEKSFIDSIKNGPNGDLFEYVEEDFVAHLAETTPDDPLLVDQYHHDLMQSRKAWDISTGASQVTVAICDTGVQLNHPDLADNRLPGYQATTQCWEDDPDCTAAVSDVQGHGTLCAGCAAAIGNNSEGVSGIGWNIKHRPGRVSDDNSGTSTDAILADCARRMCEKPDVKVVSLSWSGPESQPRRQAATYCKSKGALMVNSAGNDNRDLSRFGDADGDDLIVVGSSRRTDKKSGFSAYGTFVDVWAPGTNVLTTSLGGGYGTASGTSFSCPIVAGLIALIWSVNPQLSPDEVEVIFKNSTDIGEFPRKWKTKYGRVNSYEALKLAGTGTFSPTSSPTAPPSTATCSDVPGYLWQGRSRKNCKWAGKKAAKRCRKREAPGTEDKTKVGDYCRLTCCEKGGCQVCPDESPSA